MIESTTTDTNPSDCACLPADQVPASMWDSHYDAAGVAHDGEYRIVRCSTCGQLSTEGRTPGP